MIVPASRSLARARKAVAEYDKQLSQSVRSLRSETSSGVRTSAGCPFKGQRRHL